MLRERLLDQVEAMRAHAPNVYAYGDTTELHKLRVAVRTLRALLRAGRPLIEDERADALRTRLRELGRALGPARDADVFVAHLRGSTDVDEAGFDRLLERVEADRRAAYAAARATLDDPAFLALLGDLDDFCHEAVIRDEPLDDALAGEAKRLRKAMRTAATDADLHQARIHAKRVRYAAEAAEDRMVARRAKRFQDVVGEHQDAVVATGRLRELAEPETAILVGRLIERQASRRRHAQRRIPTAWKKLAKATR